MIAPARRRMVARVVTLDRSLERLPLFRLSDAADEGPLTFTAENGGRWRVLPGPGDRLPGTFDQDVYIELMRRFHEAGRPADGALSFTLHALLRAMGRRVDGRTYEQLRAALGRLERTSLESSGAYQIDAQAGESVDMSFSILQSVVIERRWRREERDQLGLFSSFIAAEPGDARVVLSPVLRQSLAGPDTVSISLDRYMSLPSPVARRLYRLVEVARAEHRVTWRVPLNELRAVLPLSQKYPSHLLRVLAPAHQMLIEAGILRDAALRQEQREWSVDYILA
jgi:plasmid replication initiation protein